MATTLVLITGTTGHLGFKVLLLALQAGYRVRAAVRKAEQESKIAAVRSIQPYLGNLTFVIVPDITATEAYDDAVRSVDYIVHCASPIASNAKNQGVGSPTFVPTLKDVAEQLEQKTWSELFYDPAIKGTTSVLEAASKSATVKRVVITSSIYCLDGWNRGETAGALDIGPAPSKADAEKSSIGRVEAYGLSKIFAHHAATEYMKVHNPSFELVRITSGYIQGANELNESTSDVRNGSNNATMQVALGEMVSSAKLTGQVFLDDVAKAHVVSLSPSVEVHGPDTNFIIAGNGGKGIPWDDVAEEIRNRFPAEVGSGQLTPLTGQESLLTSFEVGPSEDALGFRFAGKAEIVESLISQYLRLLKAERST